MTVIGVIGMPGSGKEEFVRVAIGFGYNIVRMGDIVREEYFKQEAEKDGITVGDFAHLERQRHGPDIWAIRTIPRIKGPCVIDGIRSLHEIERYRDKLAEGFTLINIEADKDLRFKRLRSRARDDAPAILSDFERRDSREIGWGILDAIAAADFSVENNGTLEELRENSAELIRRMEV